MKAREVSLAARTAPPHVAGLLAVLVVATLIAGCTSRQDLIARMEKNYAAANYRAAAVDLQNLVRREPGNLDFRLKLAQSLVRTGNFGDAESQFTHALQLGAAPAAVLPGLTEALLGQRKYEEAIGGLNKERPAAGEDATLLKLRGQALLGLGRAAEAREALLEAVGKAPEDPAAHLGLAQALLRLGDTGGVQAELDKASEVGPADFAVRVARGRWLAVQRQAPAARDEFARALELAQRAGNRADTVTALALLGEVESAIPDLEAAQRDLQQLQKLAPIAGATLLLQARLAVQTNHLSEAETTLKQILSKDPHNEAANVLLGIVSGRSGQSEAAESYLAAALSERPDNVMVRKLLAEAQIAGHQPQQALQTATDPRGGDDPTLLSLAGRASILEGDVAGGVAFLERSEQAAPSDKSRSLDVAAGYLAQHRSADALSLLQKLEVPDDLADRRESMLLGALADMGRTAEVHAEALRFAGARPKDLWALMIAAQGLRAAQDVAGARALIAQAAALDPKAPQPWIQLGWLEREQHDLPASQRALAHALELAPRDNAALFGAAQSDLDHGNSAGAIQKLEQVRTQAPRALAPRIALARLYLAAGQVQQADTVLAEARALSAENPDVRHLGGLLALARGKGAQAVTALEELSRQFPKVAGLQGDLARAYALAGRPADAHARAEAALQIDPNYWPALVTEIAVSLAQKNLRGAEAALERLRRTNAPQATLLTVTGDLAQRSGKLDDALEAFTAANALAPSGPLALTMAVTRRALHRADSAAPLRDWLKHSPADVAVRMALAQELQLDGQNSAAAEEYQTVLKQTPQQVVALNNLAWLKLEGGDAQAGLDLAHRAYTNNNGQPAVADTYGWALVQTGHAEDALPLLRDASGKMPGNDDVRYHLGVALVKTGAVQEGRLQLKAVADSASRTVVSEKARALLASLDAGGKG